MSYRLSIIIPVYNVDEYIEQCVESILQQTFTNYEVILVDDGSTDKSGEMCDMYAEKYTNFKVIHKTNGGVSSARNIGIDNAIGEYITFPDPDDYLADDYYSILFDTLKENPTMIPSARKVAFIGDEVPNCYGNMQHKFLGIHRVPLAPWRSLYKRSIVVENNLRFPPIQNYEDAIFNLEYAGVSGYDGVCLCGGSYFHRRMRNGSICNEYSINYGKNNRFAESLPILKEKYNDFVSRGFDARIIDRTKRLINKTKVLSRTHK